MANPTATWVGNLLKIMEEFSFIPGPPSCSLALSSRPPFVSYSYGKGWDVMDTMLPDSPQVLVGLPRRVLSHPLGSPVSEAGRSLPSATVSRQSLTSGDREARGLIHQEVVQDLLRQWPAIIVLFATSLSARLPVFFATAWHSSSLGTTSGHMPSRPLPS